MVIVAMPQIRVSSHINNGRLLRRLLIQTSPRATLTRIDSSSVQGMLCHVRRRLMNGLFRHQVNTIRTHGRGLNRVLHGTVDETA